MSQRVQGVIKWFSLEKGYGFIRREDATDVFLHRTAIQGNDIPAEGDKVEFEVIETPKGQQADNVTIITE